MPLYLLLCLLIIKPWWLAAAVFTTIPLSGIFAWNYYMLFRRIKGGMRIRKYVRTKNKDYGTLRDNYTELVALISNLKTA
jgi:hypothetical protein